SMAAALENFRLMEANKKMAILGEMRELGNESLQEHQRIIDILCTLPLDEIWLVGTNFATTNREALTTPHIVFENVEQVKEHLSHSPICSRTILIKGSNGTKLFQLPEIL
ncbi:MAG: UDP-N-acetylmuramoyl-tripeptide--D-alanyl-D-alanine ligase, partial [Bacteroidaceae bacterium]|nr:UDP-N-acetylmuramoyl-tripeptide--D-alanyl-D-alanine ligase [Bacteroidaceae bacterium]